MLEALLLYWLFFVSGTVPSNAAEVLVSFSLTQELHRIFFFDIPVVLLILYLFFNQNPAGLVNFLRPSKKALLWSLINFFCLTLIAAGISAIAQISTPGSIGILIESPHTVSGWVVLVIGSFGTAYLEETYFRFYLPHRLQSAGLSGMHSILISVLLFSLCHIYEGPWATLNAATAGCVFSIFYRTSKNIHTPALAHGFYNITAYILAALSCSPL
ncbi:MAG: type II CAAX endopeptidase family protein [Termitinemataceae bacterium]